ncbi:MAG: ribosome maturation factor RimM [Actinomycetes bacterium]
MRVEVGRVGRPHGIHGEVSVTVSTDEPARRFADGTALATNPPLPGGLTVQSTRWHSGRLLVQFAGVTDRGGAERLRGTTLVVEADLGESPEDPEEYYDHQLVGLAVRTTGGQRIGHVAEVLHLPGQDVLAVRREDGREVLVPFVTDLVPEVDTLGGELVVDPRPGLLDPETLA